MKSCAVGSQISKKGAWEAIKTLISSITVHLFRRYSYALTDLTRISLINSCLIDVSFSKLGDQCGVSLKTSATVDTIVYPRGPLMLIYVYMGSVVYDPLQPISL